MEQADRTKLIFEAIETVKQAMIMVDEALNGTVGEDHYKTHGKYGFNELLGKGNPYNMCLPSLLEYKSKMDSDPLEEL